MGSIVLNIQQNKTKMASSAIVTNIALLAKLFSLIKVPSRNRRQLKMLPKQMKFSMGEK